MNIRRLMDPRTGVTNGDDEYLMILSENGERRQLNTFFLLLVPIEINCEREREVG